ncbi:transcription initiation factor TFIID [Paenibacillus agilis]|uniref:Transcription initiation factor TFIID n=1 Tax=Paenibacillus agilis TaxID=3020863 RepID=A0A559IKJ8_9BACL|nr:transcription initiation factor TFIID [Paenibacillus agilis]TVX88137.1 transcription initiation factor TFIID [Paenibacillus agilis]
MKQLLQQFADEYASAEEKLSGLADDQSSIHYPTLFLFIGDKSAEAVEQIARINAKKWDNSAGVMYVHIASEQEGELRRGQQEHGLYETSQTQGINRQMDQGQEQELSLKQARLFDSDAAQRAQDSIGTSIRRITLPIDKLQHNQSKSLRPDIYGKWQQDERQLFEMNRTLRQVSRHISDYGRLYSSFDRIHLAVVTRVDDPMNVLVPEITLLAQSIFSQSFKSVQMDMYALLSERDQIDAFGTSSCYGVAFLRELEHLQAADYALSAPLHVTEDGIRIPISHGPAPLFDLVYVLSDKNERGISAASDMQDNYEMICHMSLLKNRKSKDAAYDQYASFATSYNNAAFKNNMMTEDGRQGYVSAGFSKVKRPNESIALTVLYHFYKQLLERLQAAPDWSSREKLALLGLSTDKVALQVNEAIPDASRINDMNGIMTHDVSFSRLKQLSLREAEEALFGEGCKLYFRDNFVRSASSYMEQLDVRTKLHATMQKQAAEHPNLNVFHWYEWTNEHEETASVWKDVRARIRDLSRELELAQAELDQLYMEKADSLSFQRLPFMDKHNVRGFVRSFCQTIYSKKLELLHTETELQFMRRYETELEQLHAESARQVQQMRELEHLLHEAALESIRTADDYIGQNIMEYYERVTSDVMQEIEAKRGAMIFFDERYVGHMPDLLHVGREHLLRKLMEVCRVHVLTAAPFHQTFEEELLRRSNVAISYDDKDVLSKEELFKRLYRTLEEQANIHIRLLDYTHEHRYEEKYFFGDCTSEFIRYAQRADEGSRLYKLGTVHEKRSSGVEKLNLMGGFHVEDLMYYRNGRVYYDSYVQNGYTFHGIDPAKLPVLR